jgi:hypothetical protein
MGFLWCADLPGFQGLGVGFSLWAVGLPGVDDSARSGVRLPEIGNVGGWWLAVRRRAISLGMWIMSLEGGKILLVFYRCLDTIRRICAF